jgi:hypothetical protein
MDNVDIVVVVDNLLGIDVITSLDVSFYKKKKKNPCKE